jgi:hypothetical protein
MPKTWSPPFNLVELKRQRRGEALADKIIPPIPGLMVHMKPDTPRE